MTGRWTSMDASSNAHTASRLRAACVAVTVLCALGVLCGVVARSGAQPHHHHGSIAAAVVIADGQGGAARSDQGAVVGGTPRTDSVRLAVVSTAENSDSADQTTVGAARQRGPPASIA